MNFKNKIEKLYFEINQAIIEEQTDIDNKVNFINDNSLFKIEYKKENIVNGNLARPYYRENKFFKITYLDNSFKIFDDFELYNLEDCERHYLDFKIEIDDIYEKIKFNKKINEKLSYKEEKIKINKI